MYRRDGERCREMKIASAMVERVLSPDDEEALRDLARCGGRNVFFHLVGWERITFHAWTAAAGGGCRCVDTAHWYRVDAERETESSREARAAAAAAAAAAAGGGRTRERGTNGRTLWEVTRMATLEPMPPTCEIVAQLSGADASDVEAAVFAAPTVPSPETSWWMNLNAAFVVASPSGSCQAKALR